MLSHLEQHSDPVASSPPIRVYKTCGIRLASTFPLPELPEFDVTERAIPDCFFELRECGLKSVDADVWIHHWYRPSGDPWRSFAKSAGTYLLRFHNFADFSISPRATRICCYPTAQASVETVRHLLLDQVIPLTLSLLGREALHASSVVTPQGACAFLGESRTGKSTLAASFVAAGYTLLGDDCLALDNDNGQILVMPSSTGIRLWPDVARALSVTSAGGSRRIPDPSLALRAMMPISDPASKGQHKNWVGVEGTKPGKQIPLKSLYVLAAAGSCRSDTVLLERLSPTDAMLELVRHAFRLDVTDQSMLARQFRFFGLLAQRIPVYRLTYARDFSVLPAVRASVFDSMA